MEKITSYFEKQGWPAHIAKGIAANLQAESGLNHQAVGDSGQAYGLAQWHPNRQADFKSLYGKDMRESTDQEQLAFIQHELTVGKEAKAGAAMRSASNEGDAARLFSKLYERPADAVGQAEQRAAIAEGRAMGAGAGRGSAQSSGATMAQAATVAPVIQQSDPTAFYEAQSKNLAATEEARPSILAMMGAAIKGAPTARIYDALFADDVPDRLDPTWAVPETAYENRSRDEIQELAETRNKMQYDNLLQRWDDESRRTQTVMDRGLGIGIALSLGAEIADPTNIATAWATAGLAAPVAAVRMASGAIKAERATAGLTRVYHGGYKGAATGDVWFTKELRDAEGWAARGKDMTIEYVDVPSSIFKADEFGVLPPTRLTLPPELAQLRKPLYAEVISAERAANIGRSVAANVASGTALELAVQMIEGRSNPENLALSLAADVTLGIPFGLAAARSGVAKMHQTAKEAVLRTEARIAEAQAKLGVDATPEQVMAKADELHTAEMRKPIDEAVAPSVQAKLMPNPEDEQAWIQPTWPSTSGSKAPTLDTYELAMPEVPTSEVSGLFRAQPQSPEFKQWFESSKATMPDGSARIVYHSTTKDFEAFSKEFLGRNTNAASAKEAFFFGGKVQTAEAYSQGREGAQVMPVYLSMQNPLVFDMSGIERRKVRFASLIQEAKSKGHDGVIIKNTFDGGPKDDIFAVFDETQVKSAIGNSGAYSKTDPRINYDAPIGGSGPLNSTSEFEDVNAMAWRTEDFGEGGVHEWAIADRTNGTVKTLEDFKKLPIGVNYIGDAVPAHMKPSIDTAMKLARKFLGNDFRLTVAAKQVPIDLADGSTVFANGSLAQLDDSAAMMLVSPMLNQEQTVRTVVHEIGHAVFNRNISKLPVEQREALRKAFTDAMARAESAPNGNIGRAERFSLTNVDQGLEQAITPKLTSTYEKDWDEFSAEQFVKYVYEQPEKLGLAASTIKVLKEAINQALEFFRLVKREAVGIDNEYKAFFDGVVKGLDTAPATSGSKGASKLDQLSIPPDKSIAATADLQNDPDVLRFGLDSMPNGTDAERADIKHMLNLWRQAEAWEKANPLTPEWEKRADNIINNAVFEAGSTGLTMLKSKNSLVRMVASRLLEDASGVQGKRGNTAAIDKYIRERAYQGNAIPDYKDAYALYCKSKGGSIKDDFLGGGKVRDEFNREVALETERRANNGGITVSKDQHVNKVVDSFHAAYERIRKDQIANKTLGWAGLPSDKTWYMPHAMSPNRVNQLTVQERQVLVDALTDQYVNIEGWDMSFADQLATRVVETVRTKALGNYDSSIGGTSSGSAEIIEDAMLTMGMDKNEVRLKMKEFNRGAANFTKKRIKLDLTKEYQVDGKTFKLLDVFEADPVTLLRGQTGRVSGEVALARVGIYGRPGMQLLRKAMSTGPDGQRLITQDDKKVLLAFDQISAEFVNAPFGTHTHKSIERAMLLNSFANLGGMGITQAAEYINGIAHVGVVGALKSVAALPRMRKEIYALVRGERIDNSLLGSIETLGGAEFGTDAYKMVMPFDSPDAAFPTYGTDTMTNADRLLRGGGYLQGKLSLWRAIHSVQQRGMAEQVVAKMARYIKEGKDDKALQGFGFTPELQAKIKLDIDKAATFDANGSCTGFDVTKFTDPDVAQAIVQNVHRGVGQIIQGTFIGETGKWAHDGYLKALTQFRTFSLVSAEKQWGRQRNAHGTMGAIGILVGAMSAAVPIYYARVYAASIGREDQEAYLERRLAPELVARSVMNYVSMAGLAGDVFDVAATLAPESVGATMTGGRTGGNTTAVGNLFAPAAGYADDVWTAMQNLDEPDKVAKVLPFHNLPYMIPIINYMAR